ncbi:uncharacterized protein LOC141641902 [Silene latifolia]|uniref:uncharacterized protein LOC141641902 n=1 Tax=Silene latifolia TaxID=37657 RepID=UPI003D76AF33
MAGDDLEPPKLDFSNPYYLGSHDIPGAKISHVTLRLDNYDDWRNSMRMSLKSRRKFGFVDGSIKKPTTKFDLDNWEVVHCTIIQWIRNTIDPSLHHAISYAEDASVLWAELEAQFSIDALIVHEPLFACKYGNCACNIGTDAIKRMDNERLHQFLMGLDPSLYSSVRSHQLQLDPLPSLSRAYQVVLQEERLRASPAPSIDASDVLVFATPNSTIDWRALRDQERGERSQFYCNFCETRGHTLNNCYIKSQNFPDWWGDRPRSLADLRRARSKARGSARGSGSGTAVSGSGQGSGSDGSAGSSGGTSSGVNPSVQAHLVHSGVSTNTMSVSDRLSGMFFWILDTGASNHVMGNLSCLVAPRTIASRPVGLPNGQQVASTLMGSVYINESLTLHDVLYVPSLTCNLISVSQLTATADFLFVFAKDSCLIQVPSTRTAIGVGELRDGLYWISARAKDEVVNSTPDSSHSSTPDSSSSGTPYSLANYIDSHSFSAKHRVFLAAITENVEPPSFKEAIRDEKWCVAMKDEIDALERNETWELTTLPPDKKAIGCRWVYKIKYHSDGTIERYKARLVVFGNHQTE